MGEANPECSPGQSVVSEVATYLTSLLLSISLRGGSFLDLTTEHGIDTLLVRISLRVRRVVTHSSHAPSAASSKLLILQFAFPPNERSSRCAPAASHQQIAPGCTHCAVFKMTSLASAWITVEFTSGPSWQGNWATWWRQHPTIRVYLLFISFREEMVRQPRPQGWARLSWQGR